MAEPFMHAPSGWLQGTLEPNPLLGLIERVETGGTPSTSVDSYWDGPIRWLTPKEISRRTAGLIVSHTERTLSEQGLQNSGARVLPVNTVMLSKRAPVGCVAVNATPMATNQGFLNFVCGPLLRPMYLAYWFVANRPYLEKIANGSTYPELYKGDLFEFQIAVPEIQLQDRTIAFLSSLDFLIASGEALEQAVSSNAHVATLQAETSTLQTLRTSLMYAVLSGGIELGPRPLAGLSS